MGGQRTRAIAVVVGTALASVAYAQLSVVQPTPTTDPAPASTNVVILVSLRNTGTTSVEIDSINAMAIKPPDCVGFSSSAMPLGTSLPVALAPGEQAQFTITASTSATESCQYAVNTFNGVADTMFTAQLQISSTPTTIQVQPLVNDFGSVAFGSSEDQYIYVENLSTAATFNLFLGLAGAPFTLQTDCPGATSCPLPSIGSDAVHAMRVRCSPTVLGTQTGTVSVYSGSGSAMTRVGGDMTLSCTGVMPPTTGMITVSPKPSLDIMTSVNVTGSGTATIGYTGSGDSLMGAAISGSDAGYFDFADPLCPGGGQTCAPASSPTLPYPLGIACTPPDTTPRSALLTVQGSMGSGDVDSTQLNCIPNAGGPHIVVSPLMVTAPTTGVGQQVGPYTILIQNTGGSTLMVSGSVMGTGSADWSVTSTCVTSPCSIAPGGGSATVDVTFAPQMFGERDAQLELDSNDTTPGDSPQIVNLYGSASGGILAITEPVSGELMFGTLPRNQLSQMPITAANQGNATIGVTITAPSPFSTDMTGFSLMGGASQTFQGQCMSGSAGNFDSYITVSATGAYQGSPAQVHVTCNVAATDVNITPTSFDFGEVRIHTPPVSLPQIMISNPTSGTVHVTRLALDATRAGLALAGGFTTDMPLAPGATLTATLTLTPDTEVDLAGVNLAIDVDGVALSFPVTGKVVTPHSTIAPMELDLGTACVGAAPAGTVVLTNDGTATLNLAQAPMMDQNFVTTLTMPTTYPATLAPNTQAMVDVRPMSSATTGPLHGTLTWSDDVPSTYQVGVDASFIAAGTALSPSALGFGTVAVNDASPLQEITVQNCDPDPVTFTIVGIMPILGRPDAWTIAPPLGYTRVLSAHDKLTIDAQFAPKQRGVYKATLGLTANGMPLTVMLTGDTSGSSLLATDFYACSCTGGGGGAGGLPIAAAILLVTCRRRRGSSSPR